jgi:hypothetical protein
MVAGGGKWFFQELLEEHEGVRVVLYSENLTFLDSKMAME